MEILKWFIVGLMLFFQVIVHWFVGALENKKLCGLHSKVSCIPDRGFLDLETSPIGSVTY